MIKWNYVANAFVLLSSIFIYQEKVYKWCTFILVCCVQCLGDMEQQTREEKNFAQLSLVINNEIP